MKVNVTGQDYNLIGNYVYFTKSKEVHKIDGTKLGVYEGKPPLTSLEIEKFFNDPSFTQRIAENLDVKKKG